MGRSQHQRDVPATNQVKGCRQYADKMTVAETRIRSPQHKVVVGLGIAREVVEIEQEFTPAHQDRGEQTNNAGDYEYIVARCGFGHFAFSLVFITAMR